MNRAESASIYSYMERMFYTPVHKVMHIQCYHYETRLRTERDANGNTSVKTEQVRVNTHSSTERYFYISWRDISGKFDLDVSGAMEKQERPFVKLHLGLAMQPAGDGTESDFNHQKNSFVWRNNRDTHYDFDERLELQGYDEHILVRVSDFQPPYFSLGWFILFTLLTVVEFYKQYMDKFCVVQDFTIRKVVSSRQDLNNPTYVQQYIAFIPTIVYMGVVKTYDGPMILAQGELLAPPPPPVDMAPGFTVTMSTQAAVPGNVAVANPGVSMNISLGASGPLLQ